MAKRMKTIAEQVRAEIRMRKLTWYQVARDSGLPESGVGRFMKGKGVNAATLDSLVKLLGLELIRQSDGQPAGSKPAARKD